MKYVSKKIKFFVIYIFIALTIISSSNIKHDKFTPSDRSVNTCVVNNSLPCDQTSTKSRFRGYTPNLELSDKARFLSAIARNLTAIPQADTFAYILLRAYGAALVNQESVITLPSTVIFADEQETLDFQANLKMAKVDGSRDCYLQESAATALNKAQKFTHIPLKSGYGASDCTRSFATNLRFWHKYANNKTLEKVKQGKETAILGIVAPPGTSQHLWGLAVDLRVSHDGQRQALNQYGWFQTVENDVPHWTYVGLSEEELSQFGFQNKVVRGITYWVTPL
ncbi:M15 family metallopeptidase [Anabaena sp. CCY 9613]|uniref:M15 family metallopeptidase n=1 Tax=Anabaena sp. CCY 9613 TaxID=3103868 RepID=UPI0039C5B328